METTRTTGHAASVFIAFRARNPGTPRCKHMYIKHLHAYPYPYMARDSPTHIATKFPPEPR
jgi:hypothetical protein